MLELVLYIHPAVISCIESGSIILCALCVTSVELQR